MRISKLHLMIVSELILTSLVFGKVLKIKIKDKKDPLVTLFESDKKYQYQNSFVPRITEEQ